MIAALMQGPIFAIRHLERRPVTLSAAKGLARRTQRSFAALRMTARTPLQSAHGKPSLHMSILLYPDLTPFQYTSILLSVGMVSTSSILLVSVVDFELCGVRYMDKQAKRTFKDLLYELFARIGKALSNGHRLELLEVLAQGDHSVETLAPQTGMSLANSSQHLQVL